MQRRRGNEGARVQITYGGRSTDGTTNPESPTVQRLEREIDELKQTLRDLRAGKLPGSVVPLDGQ